MSVHSTSAAGTSHYVALGDSIAAGTGSSLPQTRGYPSIVRNWLSKQLATQLMLTNLSVPGETTGSFISDGQLDEFIQLAKEIQNEDEEIALVTISLGGNEMLHLSASSANSREMELQLFEQNIRQVAETVRAAVGEETSIVFTNYYDLTFGDPALPDTDAWWISRFNEVIENAATEQLAIVANVEQQFRENISRYTFTPVNVHPNNQGYRAIASAVWSALGSDTENPVISVRSSPTTSRSTPTLKMTITDNVEVDMVIIQVNGDRFSPLRVGEQEYVLLLDLTNLNNNLAKIETYAYDTAGNSASTDFEFRFEPIG